MTSGYMLWSHRFTKSEQITTYYDIHANKSIISDAEVALPIAQNTVKKLFVRIWSYTMKDFEGFPVACIATVMKNGVATALHVTFSAVGVATVTGDVNFSDGDTISIRVTTSPTYHEGSATFAFGICFLSP